MPPTKDQVVVLTGANSGIGLALARALHADGRRVACLDLTGDRLAGLGFVRCDVTDPAAVDALTRTLAIEFAPHGIAVNLVHPPLTRTPSAAPLGVPARFMADPEVVGRKLARKIGSRQPVLKPGLAEAIGVLFARLVPGPMGGFLSGRAAPAGSASSRVKGACRWPGPACPMRCTGRGCGFRRWCWRWSCRCWWVVWSCGTAAGCSPLWRRSSSAGPSSCWGPVSGPASVSSGR